MSTSTVHQAMRKGTVLPPADMRELLDLSKFLEEHAEPAALLGPDGEQIPLPIEVYDVLVRVVAAMRKQRAVTIAPIEQRLTTQEAADLLGISRPTLIKLIEEGEMACEKLSGSRHRRLLLSDVLDYQSRRRDRQSDLLSKLTRDAETDQLYDVPTQQYREAVRQARAERNA
ncbi:helix-turn-helix domain-containing protein [Mycobacterium sp. M1]|uniref:Helix-turn-helix domain-containing protein n=1 Tax=Mycolicibacter acidiphilus TaxID=2835306 RepID=A0ABS5RIA1_9MYCO|nr:helix-turn-helix domain-containing protein [Mycolicibacter acidiphilus]MBS9534033.1 helix-turn-helix domain-containing protein [Mycolicibacter acidiphilus]